MPVVVVPTYRSRDVDPQSTVSLQDSVAAVEYTRALPYVDPQSIVVYGCSGGGDLALEVAAATNVCAVVPEEPASLLMAGIFNTKFPKQGERYTAQDAGPIMENPREYYTAEFQQVMRAKVARIRCPILIVQGDEDRREIPINRFNAQVLIPELRAAGKVLEVITYPGQPHCFCFTGARNQLGRVPGGPPDPRAALKASRDIDGFCQRYLKTKPKPLSSNLVRHVTL